MLKLELEKSLARLRGPLMGKETKGEMEWVEEFVRMCQMFEGRIVSSFKSVCWSERRVCFTDRSLIKFTETVAELVGVLGPCVYD